MKTLLILGLITLALVAYSTQEEPPWCRCMAFASSDYSLIRVLELPAVNITDCESHNQCRNRCTKEMNTMTNNMDLWYKVDGKTVGQYFCDELYSHFFSFFRNRVNGYYQMCGGPWEYAGLESQQKLCCLFGLHEPCII